MILLITSIAAEYVDTLSMILNKSFDLSFVYLILLLIHINVCNLKITIEINTLKFIFVGKNFQNSVLYFYDDVNVIKKSCLNT